MRRRTTIRGVCVGLAGILAGCANPNQPPERDQSPANDSPPAKSGNSGSQTVDDAVSPSPEANSSDVPQAEDDEPTQSDNDTDQTKSVELPGEPITTTGSLPIQEREFDENTNYDGYDELPEYEEDEVNIDLSADVDSIAGGEGVNLSITTGMFGTGQTSIVGVASHRTAFRPPESGVYRIGAVYDRLASVDYEFQPGSDVAASIDVSLLASRPYQESDVERVSSGILRAGTGSVTTELEEFALSTATTILIGKAFGLGLIGRFLLGRFISGAIAITSDSQDNGERNEVFESVGFSDQPQVLDAEIELTEGETIVFEFVPSVSFVFEHDDSWVMALLNADILLKNLFIEQV